MKKLCLLLCSFLLAFFLGGFVISFQCKAVSPTPSIDPGTSQLVVDAAHLLISLMYTEHAITSFGDMTNFDGPLDFGVLPYTDLWQWDSNDFTVSNISVQDRINLENSSSLYTQDGIQITDTDEIYYIEFDNGVFHGDGYIDSNGNLLRSGTSLGDELLRVAIGGNLVSAEDFLDNLSDLSDDIIDNNYFLVPDGFTMTDRSYYLYYGRTANRNKVEGWIYVSDIYNRGVTVGSGMTNGRSISNFYTNDLSTIIINNINTTYQTPFTVTSGNYTVDGYTYKYKIEMNGVVYSNNSSDYNAFQNTSNGYVSYNFSGNTFQYDTNLFTTDTDMISYMPLQFPGSKVVLDPYADYGYKQLLETSDALKALQTSTNPLYDPMVGYSAVNMPYYIIVPDSLTLESSDMVQPVQVPNSDPTVDPTITNPYPDIDSSGLTDKIPFISGLQNKFPFSIPWDIYNLLHGLSVPRQTPVLDFSITFPVINYTWEPTIDLSMYDSTATLLRTLILIIFIIGLAVFSYTHFFGS